MKEVLKLIKPDSKERKKVALLTQKIIKRLTPKLTKAKVILGGSAAKGTWLKGDHDLDFFIAFNFEEYKDKNLSEILEKSLKKAFPKKKINCLHGSRDYFQFVEDGYNLEFVPILKIERAEQALNITDVSLLHASWVKKNVNKDEVILAKKFCKANKLYGAESYIGGFSGYVLEILVGYYGTFKKLLLHSQKWKYKQVIDVAKYYPRNNCFFHLNKSKLQSPIIVIDPVDKNRNAAAALTKEKFTLFKKLAKSYLKKPEQSYFKKTNLSLASLGKEKNLLLFEILPLGGKRDAVGGKLLKLFKFLTKELEEFSIIKKGWEWEDKCYFYFVLKKNHLPEVKIRPGPPLDKKEYVKDFKKKNKDTFVENSKVMARIKVEFPELNAFAKNLIRQKYVKERVKKIKLVPLT